MNCCMVLIRIPFRYKWIGLLDVDEVIVPRKQNSLVEMMDEIESKEEVKGFTSWYFKSFFVTSDLGCANVI